MNKLVLSLSLIIFILLIGLGSANDYKKQNSWFNITDTCTLDNGLICDSSFNCNFTVTYKLDDSILLNNKQASKDNLIFYYTLNDSYTSKNGDYQVDINCYNNSVGGKDVKYFTINPSGEEPTIPKVFLYISLLFVLLVIFGVIMWAHMKDTGQVWKVWWFSIMWLWIIAVSFISFNIARDFITSNGFIQSFFYLIWLVTIISFPFYIIFCIGYTFYFIYEQKAVQDLIQRGFSQEDAQQVVNERRGIK